MKKDGTQEGSESTEGSIDEKPDDESVPAKRAKIENEKDEQEALPTSKPSSEIPPQTTSIQQLISTLVSNGARFDAQKCPNVNPFVTTLTCGLPVCDTQRSTQNNLSSITLADLLTKQTPQPISTPDLNASGLLTAICETPGQPPKSVLISKSVAAAFAAAAMNGNNNVNPAGVLATPQTQQLAEEHPVASDASEVTQATVSSPETSSAFNGSGINLLRCNPLSAPISINLPINTQPTVVSQPSFTVIGNLPNNGPAIVSIGNTATRNIATTNNVSAIAAILRGLSQQKVTAAVTTSATDPSVTSTVTTLASETPIMATETKTSSETVTTSQLPVDLNSLAAAVAAVTGALPRNPTISPGPLPGSILLSCPKVVTGNEQAPSLLTTSETPASVASVIPAHVKQDPSVKESNDTAIDQILENIRRATEAEKAARAAKIEETKASLLIAQSNAPRLPLPAKKANGKLTPVAPCPANKAGLVSSVTMATQSNSQRGGVPMESVHKVYKCRYCGKTFNRKFCRERHERLHTGVKPYNCEICDEKFIRLEDKKRHVRSILHTSRVVAAQASGKVIPAGLDPQEMSEGDGSPTSEHTFSMEDSTNAEAQTAEAESSDDPLPMPTSPSPPTQASFKHSRRSEMKQSNTPTRLIKTEAGVDPG